MKSAKPTGTYLIAKASSAFRSRHAPHRDRPCGGIGSPLCERTSNSRLGSHRRTSLLDLARRRPTRWPSTGRACSRGRCAAMTSFIPSSSAPAWKMSAGARFARTTSATKSDFFSVHPYSSTRRNCFLIRCSPSAERMGRPSRQLSPAGRRSPGHGAGDRSLFRSIFSRGDREISVGPVFTLGSAPALTAFLSGATPTPLRSSGTKFRTCALPRNQFGLTTWDGKDRASASMFRRFREDRRSARPYWH